MAAAPDRCASCGAAATACQLPHTSVKKTCVTVRKAMVKPCMLPASGFSAPASLSLPRHMSVTIEPGAMIPRMRGFVRRYARAQGAARLGWLLGVVGILLAVGVVVLEV